jgi:hypothetical protein
MNLGQTIPLNVTGHVLIKDDLGNVLVDKYNAVHPRNMARAIARAFAKESNYWIYKMKFGNGGTYVNAAGQITYRTPNDGIAPDTTGWQSQLYNCTYWEVVDATSTAMGTGPGAVASDDPTYVSHVSGDGVRSYPASSESVIRVQCTLNPDEPLGQYVTDQEGSGTVSGNTYSNTENPNATFTFDEIGLFTSGLDQSATAGTADVNVNTMYSTSSTGLSANSTYKFDITVNGGATQNITITTTTGSGTNGEILYGDLVSLINAQITNATCSISDGASVNTYGYLRFTSNSVATSSQASTVLLSIVNYSAAEALFSNLTSYVGLITPVAGTLAGVEDDAVDPDTEAERLLTHLIFSPVAKTANRTLTIVYTITVSVAASS